MSSYQKVKRTGIHFESFKNIMIAIFLVYFAITFLCLFVETTLLSNYQMSQSTLNKVHVFFVVFL